MSASSEFTGKSFRPKGVPTEITSGTGTHTPPGSLGMWYRYTITSGGGAGGSGNGTNGAGGGGGGGTRRGVIFVPSTGASYTIGAGGAGSSAAVGANGGATVFGRIVVAGGRGGRRHDQGGQGGAGGGLASAPASGPADVLATVVYVPDGVVPGGSGGSNDLDSAFSRAPAMPAGHPGRILAADASAYGLTQTPVNGGGGGGSSEFGTGASSVADLTAAATNASGFGAGGGGAARTSGGVVNGSSGTGGRIYLEPLGVW